MADSATSGALRAAGTKYKRTILTKMLETEQLAKESAADLDSVLRAADAAPPGAMRRRGTLIIECAQGAPQQHSLPSNLYLCVSNIAAHRPGSTAVLCCEHWWPQLAVIGCAYTCDKHAISFGDINLCETLGHIVVNL